MIQASALANDVPKPPPDLVCSTRNDPKRMMNWYQNIVYSQTRDEELGVQESNAVARSPYSALVIRDIGKGAIRHSNMFCKPERINSTNEKMGIIDSEDNEVDAIRHFVLATLLQYEKPKHALEFLLAHEIKAGVALDASNMMDLHNNQKGIAFGKKLAASSEGLKRDEVSFRALEEALKLLKSKQLQYLKPAISGDCRNISEKSDSEIKQLLDSYKEHYPQMLKNCEENKTYHIICGVQKPKK